MNEVRSGIRNILSSPIIYDTFQTIVGAYKWRKKYIDMLINNDTNKSLTIIDIGCGTAKILGYLTGDIEYIGFDRNKMYIDKANTLYKNKNATFLCQELSIDCLPTNLSANIVLAFGLLHHLNDDEGQQLFKLAKSLLKKNGFFLTLDPLFTDNQSYIAKYIISKDRGTAVRTQAGYESLAKLHFSSVETFVDLDPIYIPYTGIVMKCSN